MKKVIAILLAVCCVLSLSACGTSSTTTYTTVWGKSDVYEVSTYKITSTTYEDGYFEGAPEVEGEGTYVSIISGNSTDGFLLETTLYFAGVMDFDGSKETFVQTVTSKVYFADVTGNLAPTYSEKSFDGTTIVYDSETGEFSSADLSYVSTVTYGEDDAVVSIKTADGTDLAQGIPSSQEISLSGNVYDNEQIFLVARSLVKDGTSSIALSVASPIVGLTSVALYVAEEDEEETSTLTQTVNGVSQTFDIYTMSMQLNSSFESGTATLLVYAKDDFGNVTTAAGNPIEVDRSRLLKISHLVPYTSTVLSYDLVEYTSNMS